jgi:hypothetical protein
MISNDPINPMVLNFVNLFAVILGVMNDAIQLSRLYAAVVNNNI